eukprot:3298563-Pleurochrysis_carterae.AAC.1
MREHAQPGSSSGVCIPKHVREGRRARVCARARLSASHGRTSVTKRRDGAMSDGSAPCSLSCTCAETERNGWFKRFVSNVCVLSAGHLLASFRKG